MTRILVRCDASFIIGSGHVMRCRTLARELHKRGANPIFLCRRQPGDLISLLEQEFSVVALPERGWLLVTDWLAAISTMLGLVVINCRMAPSASRLLLRPG